MVAGVSATAVIAAPTILGATSKSGTRLPVIGQGEYLFEAVRWLGWLPLAAAFLWLREQVVKRSSRSARA